MKWYSENWSNKVRPSKDIRSVTPIVLGPTYSGPERPKTHWSLIVGVDFTDFAFRETPYGMFGYDLTVLREGVSQMGWEE